MGHKKRNLAARPKQSPAASPTAATKQVVGGAATADGLTPDEVEPFLNPETPNRPVFETKIDSPKSIESDGSSFSNVKLECERALTALRRGNHTKALRLMKEFVQRYENSAYSALVYRVQGTVCVKVASLIDDQNAKNRHLRSAIESARKAVELSPNSIEFGHFYANLLYEVANEAKDYEETVRECERALAIVDPVDPAKESLQDETQQKISTVEARIGHVQNELRQLIQKSNIASLSSWMKNLGNGEDKFRLIPIRRVAEDPMEVRLVQARRPNEIKKATKTEEERRKEIEVRVAAARLLQQKSEVPLLENEEEKPNKGLDSTPVSGQRRKSSNLRKNRSSAENRDLVRSFWNSVSLDKKRDLLKIGVSDLKSHFGLLKDGLSNEVLSEALSFAETHCSRSWKFWVCCRCNNRFADSESHMHHVEKEHMGSLLPKLQSVMPQSVDDEWIEMLLNCSWNPLDVSAAVKMLRNQTKCEDSEFVEDFSLGNRRNDCDGCFLDAQDSSLDKGTGGDSHIESSNHDKLPNIEPRERCEGNGSMAYSSLADSWPVSDDSECAKLLEKIRDAFDVLIRHKCLASSHLDRVLQMTKNELQSNTLGCQLLNCGVEQTPMCISFLGASQLQKILKFLQDLSQSCGLGRHSEKSSNIMDGAKNGSQSLEIKEQIVLSGDASFLLIDECLLSAESTHISGHHGATDKAAAAVSEVVSNANGVLNDSSAMLSWIFAGPTSGEELASWMRVKEEKASEGVEILQMLEKEFYQLQSFCERKCEQLSYEEALQAVEDLCVEGGKKREDSGEFVYLSFDSILKRRREELLESSDNDMYLSSSRFELEAISNVLKQVENLNANQFGYEETYGGLTSQLCDLESGEDDDWRAKDYLRQVDTCIEVAIQRLKDQLYVELCKIDARILRNVTGMQQLELKLEPVTALDYQSILLPLVKSYLRAHLEDLAEKDATEKSDAAREAFLAELALDSKKVVRGGTDSSRHTQEKTKDKKKTKEYRKLKDSKVTGVSESLMHYDEIDDPASLPVAYDGDHQDSEIVVSVNGDDLKQQEEELKRRIELEAEERKLEETLEFQRRMENEAKQKLLAEQHRKATQTYHEKVAEGMLDANLESGSVDLVGHEQFKPSMQENLANNLDVFPIDTPNYSAPSFKYSTASCTQTSREDETKIVQTLPNEGISEDGYLPSERRAGKRGRRQKNSVKGPDGKHQFLSSPREGVEVGSSHPDVQSDSINSASGDDGGKTLRQLQAEEDDEERFQADLKKAVRQSLDTFEAHKKLPSVSSLKTLQRVSGEVDRTGVPNDVQVDNTNEGDVFGTGLKNEVGEYNCFLNVIIQSLWHIRRFRDEFLRRSTSEHVHVGDPCVICALYEIFSALSIASTDTRSEAVAPTSLRIALSNLYPDSNFFQEAQMNDASEVLEVIFDCLHRSFTSDSRNSEPESVASSYIGSWDCANSACIVHSIFGMDIFERMNCSNCGLESKNLKYTTFFHNINASALRTMKALCAESSFGELLNLVEMNHQLSCDPEAGGCGKLNNIHHILSSPPHVFTMVLGWQNTCESIDDITATLAALNTEIDISALYRGLDSKNTHSLVSVVCYYGQHYHCFAYSHDHGRWIMYDDQTVKVIGSWGDVLTLCERGHLQPQVLLFEAVN
ncbi:Zinc finger, C2H [Trema orientale]|uniref:Zinc finger, C2H n=1 Tax=Trema orientale TaxID=63057 RepID=A0A2P5EKK8_TREOI|nr:Zinc finger, C2H [Trema orientale]